MIPPPTRWFAQCRELWHAGEHNLDAITEEPGEPSQLPIHDLLPQLAQAVSFTIR